MSASPPIPWTPGFVSLVTPGLVALCGTDDRYRFEIRQPDGHTTVVEHYVAPTPTTPSERRAAAASVEARVRRQVPGYDFDEQNIPSHKPAHAAFLPARDGRLMVNREGEGRWDEKACGPEDEGTPGDDGLWCHRTDYRVDVYASDGSYLGSFLLPAEAPVGGAFIKGDEIWTYGADEAGHPVVKGYRIVLPRDASSR